MYSHFLRIAILFTILFLFLASCSKNTDDVSLQFSDHSFSEMLEELDEAISLFVNGDGREFTAMWADSDSITIAGAFGGQIEQGKKAVIERLGRVGQSYSKTDFFTERINYGSDTHTGYLVQREFFRFFNEAEELLRKREYRVTMLFIKEDGIWRVLHRHADLSTEWTGLD